MFRRILAAIFFLFLTSISAFSQIATGIYEHGAFDNRGLDTINLGNLNVHMVLPLLNKPGRGLPFYYNLNYDSSVWTPVGVSGAQTWTPNPNWGWRGDTEVATGYISYSTATSSSPNAVSSGSPQTSPSCITTTYSNFKYHDAFGVIHPFGVTTSRVGGSNCGSSTPSGSQVSPDGSGYTLNVSNYTTATLVNAQGKTIAAPNTIAGSGSAVDSNGNEIIANGSGGFTDTLGKTALTVAGGAPSNKTFTYTDTSNSSQSVTMAYKTYTVQVKFGCSTVSDPPSSSVSLVDSITFPDGSAYHFTYEPTPGVSGAVTGRLASVTEPAGGVIGYTYTGANNGIMCSDGSAAGLTRTQNSVSASTVTYTRSTGNGGSHTEVVDAKNNDSNYDFVQPTSSGSAPPIAIGALFYEVNRNNWTGSETGQPTYYQQTCYNNSGSYCVGKSIVLPITQVDTFQQSGTYAEKGSRTLFNSFGEVTEIDTHDYGTPYVQGKDNRGPILTKELFVYGGDGAPANLVSSHQITDGTTYVGSQTTYAYDQSTPAASSGVPSHIAVTGPRGNLTSMTSYSSANTSYTTTFSYEDTGSLLSSVDPINGKTAYAYDSTLTYPTVVQLPTPSSGVAIFGQAGYDTAYTGLPTSSTDPNGQVVSYAYDDSRLRMTKALFPDGGEIDYTYPNPLQTGILTHQTSSSTEDMETLYDAYGRVSRIAKAAIGAAGSTSSWYQQDTCYDANGNVSFVSYAYTGGGWSTPKVCANAGDAYTYDVLGRPLTLTHADGTSVQYTYQGRATQVKDENGVTRSTQADGLGRISLVCELSSSSLNGVSPVSCGTDTGGQGFVTTYTYNVGSTYVQVAQGAQTRLFQTDWLGRPTLTKEPERGSTSYRYQSNGTGLIVTRTRPSANQPSNSAALTTTTTQYDTLGRVLSVTYNDSLTPTKNYSYDVGNWAESGSQQYLKGRLSLASTSAAGTLYSYDPMGRVKNTWQCTPSTCGNSANDKPMSFIYDLSGALLSQSDLVSGTITYGRSVAGEITAVTNSTFQNNGNPANLVSNVVNGPDGQVSYKLGNGLNVYKSYDSMGRGTGRWLCNGPAAQYCNGGTQVYGNSQAFRGSQVSWNDDTAVGKQLVFAYDGFNRLASTSLYQASSPAYTYAYDLYGNRLKQTPASGGNTFNASFDPTTNRINSSGYTYDPAGNMTNDSFHNYTFDAEGNILTVDGGNTAKYVYDALNQRVQSQVGSSTLEYVYDYQGRKISTWAEPANKGMEGRIYSDNQQLAFRSSDGTTYFDHQDYLGTERMRTNSAGTAVSTYSSLSWGDGYSASVSVAAGDLDSAHFAGLDQDLNSANAAMSEHAQFRNYSFQQGRWLSPDPYSGSYDITNPQSLNRYAYVLNNPLSFTDKLGLDCDDDNGTFDPGSTDSDIGINGGCYPAGGGPPCFAMEGGGCFPSPDLCGFDPALCFGGNGGASGSGAKTTAAPPVVAPSIGACNIQRATSGVMGAANLGLAVGKGFELGGAVAGLGATGVGAPAAAVLAVYGTVSIFGQGLTGAAQLYSAATGNYGTAAQVAQIGNILSGPVSGLGTLLRGGSLAAAERNAGYESAFTAGAGLIDAIRAGGAGLPLAMSDHSTAQMSLFGAGGGNACGAGH